LFFGAVAVVELHDGVSRWVVCYALLSLTLIRMLPVAVSLVGAGFDRATVAFVGWFGPRGLASAIFALLALDDLHDAAHEAIDVIALTVLLSVLVHGLTAVPLARRYGRTQHAGTAPSAWPS
jgi:NhaP-type Na+/H+ or K+/H+ antiporter